MARRIQQKIASDLRVGDVTIYGVLLEKRDANGGYLMYYPGPSPIHIEFHQSLPVFCRAPEMMLEAINEAIAEESDRLQRQRLGSRIIVEREHGML